MQVYHWSEVRTIAGAYNGEIVVYAETKEQAIDLAEQAYSTDDSPYALKWRAHLRQELESTEPVVHSAPVAFLMYGSD